jgi:NADH/NAD ratio-sensing transcriptional regulator Rex
VLVRKDLESTGIAGLPRRGFPTAGLARSLEASLAWGGLNKASLIGAGRLGSLLAASLALLCKKLAEAIAHGG